MTPDQQEALFTVAMSMAQDLREYADAASEAGESIETTEQLLEEFDALVAAMDQEAHEASYSKELPEWVRKLGVTS